MGADNASVLLSDGRLSPAELRELEAAGTAVTEPTEGVADRPRPLNVDLMLERQVLERHDDAYGAVIEAFHREVHG
jgi:hypothetical protein